MKKNESNGICCPEFDPAPWNDVTIEWKSKKFIKSRVFTLMFMPLNFGSVMRRVHAAVVNAGGHVPDWLCLSDHTSKWNMDVYLAVDREIPGQKNTEISGTFYCRAYEGPFTDTGKWCEDYASAAKNKGYEIKKWFMWYTTCPKCAKKYGKNYVVILGRV